MRKVVDTLDASNIRDIGLNELQPYVRLVQRILSDERYRLPSRIIYDHEIIYTTEGSCLYDIEGESLLLEPGSLLFMKPYVRHQCRVPKGCRFEYYAVHFDYVHMGDNHDFSVDEIYLQQDYAHAEEITVVEDLVNRPVVRPGGIDFPYVLHTAGIFPYERHFKEMLEAHRHGRFGDSLTVQGAMLHILGAAIRELTDDEGIDRRHPQWERIQNAITYMKSHYAAPIDLTKIAGAVHLSVGHFRSLFKAATGKTPIAYMTDIRMARVKERLLEGKDSITRIAEETGYPDVHYFSRLFKKLEGLSPSQFSDSLRNRE